MRAAKFVLGAFSGAWERFYKIWLKSLLLQIIVRAFKLLLERKQKTRPQYFRTKNVYTKFDKNRPNLLLDTPESF